MNQAPTVAGACMPCAVATGPGAAYGRFFSP